MNLGKESETKEFKETTAELEEALIDMTAMLNKHGHGELYIGVKNNGDVCGFQIGESTSRDVERKIFESIKPALHPTITEETEEGKKYIKVVFSGISKPYCCSGKYYIRVNDVSRELSPLELTTLILNSNYQKWEEMVSSSILDDADENALREFLTKAIEAKRMGEEKYDRDALLNKLGLVFEDGFHLNNAGRILFSKSGPIKLKMAVFATNEKRTFLDINERQGNIFSLIDEAEAYVKKNIRWGASIVDFERIETPEIPVEALREIIVNSFAHANYIGTSVHEIDIHPDRIAIYNPGSFPDGFIPEDFRNKSISSKIRNELICDVLFKCRKIESWSTGFRKTFSLCEEAGVEVGYEKEYDGFWFFFKRKGYEPSKTTEFDSNGLSELTQIVLSEIEKNPYVTRDSLSSITGRTSRHIQRSLDVLKEKGIIIRVNGNRNGHWEVKKQ